MKRRIIIIAVVTILLFSGSAWAACSTEALNKAYKMYSQASEKAEQSELEAAELDYESALNFCRDFNEAHLYLGKVQYELGTKNQVDVPKIKQAATHLKKGVQVKNQAQLREARVYLGLAYLALDALPQAEKELAQAKEHTLAPYGLAELYWTRYQKSLLEKDKTEALRQYGIFCSNRNEKDFPQYYQTAFQHFMELRYGTAGKTFNQVWIAYSRNGRQGDENTKCREALPRLDQAIKEAGGNFPEAHLLAGEIFLKANVYNKEKAIEHLSKAETLPRARWLLAQQYLTQQPARYEDAERLLNSLQNDDEFKQKVLFSKACIKNQQGEKKEAVELSVICIKQNPDSAIALNCRQLLESLTTNPSPRAIPPEVEIEMEKFGGLTQDPRQATVQAIVDAIVKEANLHGAFHVFVLANKKANAFALRTNDSQGIYITQGLLDFTARFDRDGRVKNNNDVLAFIVSHELAHLTQGHPFTVDMMNNAKHQIKSDAKTDEYDVAVIRVLELEADQIGLKLMYLAGYDPQGAIAFLMSFAQAYGESPKDSDHPQFIERSRALYDYWQNVAFNALNQYSLGLKYLKDAETMPGLPENKNLQAGHLAAKLAGLYERALQSFQPFRLAFPTAKEAHNNIGFCHLQLALLEQRKEPYEQQMWRIEGEYDPRVFVYRGQTMGPNDPSLRLEYLNRAKEEFRATLVLDPEYEYAALNMGAVLLMLGEFEESGIYLSRAYRDPQLGRMALNNSGVLLVRQGNKPQAASRFRQVLDQDKNNRAALYNLALLAGNSGDKALARQYIDRYFNLEPETTGWRLRLEDLRKKL